MYNTYISASDSPDSSETSGTNCAGILATFVFDFRASGQITDEKPRSCIRLGDSTRTSLRPPPAPGPAPSLPLRPAIVTLDAALWDWHRPWVSSWASGPSPRRLAASGHGTALAVLVARCSTSAPYSVPAP
eukprot:308529-Rhodomonas_salina.1